MAPYKSYKFPYYDLAMMGGPEIIYGPEYEQPENTNGPVNNVSIRPSFLCLSFSQRDFLIFESTSQQNLICSEHFRQNILSCKCTGTVKV